MRGLSENPEDRAEELARAMDAADIGAWRWDLASDAVHMSRRSRILMDHTHTAVLAYPDFLALVHPLDREVTNRALHASIAACGPFDLDFRIASPAAEGRWIRATGRSLAAGDRTAGDKSVEVRAVLIDAGKQKDDEDANNRLAAIVTSSDDAIIGKSLAGIVTDWNRGAETIFGYAAEEIIGKPISILVPGGQEDETFNILERVKQGERIDHYETRRRCKNGRIIDVSLTVSPVWDRSGRLLGASKVARDVTAARRAQTALMESEAHLRSVLDTIPDAMVVVDQDGLIQSFSKAAEQLFGYVANEIVGQNVKILMPAPDRANHGTYMARYLKSGERHIIGQPRVVLGLRKDGTTFPMELSIGEVKSGNRRLFTGFGRDLTEREASQRQLQSLQAELVHMSRFTAMGEMASALAHELNQPLTAIMGYLNGCQRLLEDSGTLQTAILRDGVARAAEQAMRAGQIIRRLRQFVARGESERRAESLPKLVEEAGSLALVGVREAGVRVTYNFDPRADLVLADKIQIQQVLLNLIRNALEAMQETERRELTISTSDGGSRTVLVSVMDSGPGISETVAAQLFQPFTTTKSQGMGLGLSISRTIVEAHGGRLGLSQIPQAARFFT